MEEFRFELPTEWSVTIDNIHVSVLTKQGLNRAAVATAQSFAFSGGDSLRFIKN